MPQCCPHPACCRGRPPPKSRKSNDFARISPEETRGHTRCSHGPVNFSNQAIPMLVRQETRRMMAVCALLVGAAGPAWALPTSPSCIQRDTPNLILPGDPTWAADLNVYPNASNDGTVADRKSTRLNSSHSQISYAVFCLKKKTYQRPEPHDTVRR